MLDAVGVVTGLVYGTALVWAGFNITRFLTLLVRPTRPRQFVALHMTAVWSAGGSASLAGIALLVYVIATIGSLTAR